MLGFSAYGEVAFGEADPSAAVNAFVTGVSGTTNTPSLITSVFVSVTLDPGRDPIDGIVGTISIDGIAIFTIPSAIGTGAAGSPTGSGGSDKTVTGVANSATAVAAFSNVSGEAGPTPPSATITTAAGTFTFDAKANITLNAATADADLTVNSFGDEDAQATTTITGVVGTGAVEVNDDPLLNGGIYSDNIVFLNTDFVRTRTINIVPYRERKVYITR